MTIYLTVEGTTHRLDPDRKYTVGFGGGFDIGLAAPHAPGALLEIRRRPHWLIKVLPEGAQIRADGATVSGRYVHLPTPVTRGVVVDVRSNDTDVSLRLDSAPVPAVVAQPAATRAMPASVPALANAPVLAPASVPAPVKPPRPQRKPSERPLLIGSSPDADIIVEGPAVAAEHALLQRSEDGYRLRDLGRGGTFVAGKPILWARLRPGDSFTIGEAILEIHPDGRVTTKSLGAPDLWVSGLGASVKGRRLLADVSFSVRAASLLAIVGPSGSGKTTLFRTLLGEMQSDSGEVVFRGLDLRTHNAEIRRSLGFVPQQDHLHESLTVRAALWYTSLYRLPLDWSANRRRQRIEEICERLGLADHLGSKIHTLSGGQKKRVSIALEILSHPSLLLLDEPTSGLDADLARDVMRLLGDLARDERCTVMVITHASEDLGTADDVLAFAEGGQKGGAAAYAGPPSKLLGAFGANGFADLMGALRKGVVSRSAPARTPRPAVQPDQPGIASRVRRNHPRLLGQLGILIRRQLALLRARGVAAVGPLVVAFIGAALAGTLTSDQGLAGPGAPPALSLLVTLCVVAGQALVYGDIVAEYQVIRREHRIGIAPSAVVLSKLLVFGGIAVLQAAVVVLVYLAYRPGPATGLLDAPDAELFIGLAATTVAAMCLGLLISAHAKTLERAIMLATVSVVVQVGLNGIAFALADKPIVAALAYPLPARWGLAAVASSMDLRHVAPRVTDDALWTHTTSQWLFNIGLCAVLSASFAGLAWLRLRQRLNAPEGTGGRRRARR